MFDRTRLLEQGLDSPYDCVEDKIADCISCGDAGEEIWDMMVEMSGEYPEWKKDWERFITEQEIETRTRFVLWCEG